MVYYYHLGVEENSWRGSIAPPLVKSRGRKFKQPSYRKLGLIPNKGETSLEAPVEVLVSRGRTCNFVGCVTTYVLIGLSQRSFVPNRFMWINHPDFNVSIPKEPRLNKVNEEKQLRLPIQHDPFEKGFRGWRSFLVRLKSRSYFRALYMAVCRLEPHYAVRSVYAYREHTTPCESIRDLRDPPFET
eukprot:1196131-Prorocentrum_minimum.AAC.4